jgi:hypothetical protein
MDQALLEQLLKIAVTEIKANPEVAMNFINSLVEHSNLNPDAKAAIEALVKAEFPNLVKLLG